ncbi:MAG: hypothetical protein NC483_01735 [Ruminococcus sp.]|nr:hypothetical protein [Ruminococcus sp.]
MEFYKAVRENSKYINIAKELGFFSDNEDLALCTDYIIVHWIAGLEKDNLSIKKFKEEILPNFRTWHQNGVNTNYVGEIYDFLVLAEMHGLVINKDTYNCLNDLTWTMSSKVKKINSTELDSILFRSQTEEVIKKLIHFQELGLPLGRVLAENYSVLCYLEQKGEQITFDTLVFLHTANAQTDEDAIALYRNKKELEKEYNCIINSGEELKKISSWLGGYNFDYVSELREEEQKCNNKIYSSKDYDRMREIFETFVGKEMTVSFYVIGGDGKPILRKIKGTLTSLKRGCSIRDFGTINLENAVDTNGIEMPNFNIEDADNYFILRVIVDNKEVYKCKTIKERIRASKLNSKANALQSMNLLKSYLERFGTIEGLGYLKTSAKQFILEVDPHILPVNNLFAYCYEVIYRTFYTGESLLEYVLYAYNYILSGKVECLQGSNYGYQFYHFLSKRVQEVVKNICYYVLTSGLKEEIPGEPNSLILMLDNYAHLTPEAKKAALENNLLNQGFVLNYEISPEDAPTDGSNLGRR